MNCIDKYESIISLSCFFFLQFQLRSRLQVKIQWRQQLSLSHLQALVWVSITWSQVLSRGISWCDLQEMGESVVISSLFMLSWPGNSEWTYWWLIQAAACPHCPPVYHTRWRLHIVFFRCWTSKVFGLTQLVIEHEFTVSVANAIEVYKNWYFRSIFTKKNRAGRKYHQSFAYC